MFMTNDNHRLWFGRNKESLDLDKCPQFEGEFEYFPDPFLCAFVIGLAYSPLFIWCFPSFCHRVGLFTIICMVFPGLEKYQDILMTKEPWTITNNEASDTWLPYHTFPIDWPMICLVISRLAKHCSSLKENLPAYVEALHYLEDERHIGRRSMLTVTGYQPHQLSLR